MLRSVSIDDAPMSPSSKKVLCAAVFSRGPEVEGIEVFSVTRDGLDSTKKIFEALSQSKFLQGTKLVLTDSLTLAGLNLIDLQALSSSLEVPVVAVTRIQPEEGGMHAAILRTKRFSKRLQLLQQAGPPARVSVGGRNCFIQFAGCGKAEATRLLREAGIGGLRLSHLLAGALARK